MTEKKITDATATATKNSKLAELKARVHKHDITIKTSDGEKKVISRKEWCNILTDKGAVQKPPVFSLAVVTAISAYAAASEGEKLSRQYGTEHEAHFGFTHRSAEDIRRIKEMFEIIDHLTFATATYCECDTVDLSALVKALVGNDVDVVVESESMEKLNWMFKRVQFLCSDILRDNGFDNIPKFYSVNAEKNGIILENWLVTADYVSKVFGGGEDITITDDGMTIRFTPIVIPAVAEIYEENDNYCLVSFYDAVKNLVTEMYYKES